MMRFMALSYFAKSPMLAFPLLALVIFMLVFGVITLREILKGKQSYEAVSNLPLESGSREPEGKGKSHGY